MNEIEQCVYNLQKLLQEQGEMLKDMRLTTNEMSKTVNKMEEITNENTKTIKSE